jgi:hypothetical protein
MLTGRTTAVPPEIFVFALLVTSSGSGVSLTGGTVRIGPQGSAAGYAGPVVELAGKQLLADVSGPAGQRRAQFTMTISGSVVTGTVTLRAASGG